MSDERMKRILARQKEQEELLRQKEQANKETLLRTLISQYFTDIQIAIIKENKSSKTIKIVKKINIRDDNNIVQPKQLLIQKKGLKEEEKKKEFEKKMDNKQWKKDETGKWVMISDKNLAVDYDPVKPPRDLIFANSKSISDMESEFSKVRWKKVDDSWETCLFFSSLLNFNLYIENKETKNTSYSLFEIIDVNIKIIMWMYK